MILSKRMQDKNNAVMSCSIQCPVMNTQVQRCQKALSLDSNALWAKDAHKLLAASQAALQQAEASSDSSAGHATNQQSEQQQSQHQPASEQHDSGTAAAESDTESVADFPTYGQYSYTYGSDGRESSNPSPEPGLPSHDEGKAGDKSDGDGLLMKAFTGVLGKHCITCCRECASNSPEAVSTSIQQDASAYLQHD